MARFPKTVVIRRFGEDAVSVIKTPEFPRNLIQLRDKWLTVADLAIQRVVGKMLGILGLMGALLAGLLIDTSPADEPADDDAPEAEAKEIRASGVSTAFMDDSLDTPVDQPASFDPAEHGGTEPDGLPKSDDLPDDPDLALALQGGDGQDELAGEGADDSLSGGGGADLLEGHGGADQLQGEAGFDHLMGGDGNDSLAGGGDGDSLWGDDGDDSLWGDLGDDDLAAGAGADLAEGGEGQDKLQGGEGDDTLGGGAGDDTLTGATGADLLAGGAGSDEVDGGDGADTLHGGNADAPDDAVDFLNGGAGDDLLMTGAGDYASGGEGSDVFAVQDIQPGDPLTQITDFDPVADQLVVLYDATVHPDPQLSIRSVAGSSLLLLDGVPLAAMTNGAEIDLSQVQLRAA